MPIVLAALAACFGSAAIAETPGWRATPGFLPAEAAPAFIASSPAMPNSAPADAGAFSEALASETLDPDVVSVAIRADTERLAADSDMAMASSEQGADPIGGRVVDAFQRFAAIDAAGGYASRDYAMREPARDANRTFAGNDPKVWTPAAPDSLVAYDAPRQ